ncbi:hypothetical protein PUN28_013524 [Cardiocondyla obscurior]
MLPLILLVVGVFAQQTLAEEPEAIVGGTPAKLGDFPHQCSLRSSGSHVCGCSIIDSTKILTAAHCVDGIATPPYNNYKVATGSIDIKGGELHDVKTARVHPQYTGRSTDAWNNDIAVITLKAPIQFNDNQKPIALATSTPAPGAQSTLSGWGQIRGPIGPLPRSLLYMHQVIMDQKKCQQRHYDMPLTGSHLCAFNRYGIGACSGDSGGPLISNGVQVGITSWVLPCAKGEPDVYTNVAHHTDFIKSS